MYIIIIVLTAPICLQNNLLRPHYYYITLFHFTGVPFNKTELFIEFNWSII